MLLFSIKHYVRVDFPLWPKNYLGEKPLIFKWLNFVSFNFKTLSFYGIVNREGDLYSFCFEEIIKTLFVVIICEKFLYFFIGVGR